MPRKATTRLPGSTVARHVAVEAVNPRRHSLFTCTRQVRRRGLELKPRVLSELGTSAAGATESPARWPTTLVACTLAVDERTRAAPVKPVKSRLLTRYNAAAVVLQLPTLRRLTRTEAAVPQSRRGVLCRREVKSERETSVRRITLSSLPRRRTAPRVPTAALDRSLRRSWPHNLNRRPPCHRVVSFSALLSVLAPTDRDPTDRVVSFSAL